MSLIVKTRSRKVSEDEKFVYIMSKNDQANLLTLEEAKALYSKMKKRKR